MTTISYLTLDQLTTSADNVRKGNGSKDVADLAASIQAHGLLQNLQVVERGGKFEVIAGGRRLAALMLLAKQGKITADFQIACNVLSATDPALKEISLAENVVRRGMHPADEFVAFKNLADAGQGVETIAARFGTTPILVKQRLKLAVVSPKLIAAFRKDEMTLDQLMAFTLTDDQKTQERVWSELPEWSKKQGDDRAIRRALTEQHIAADGKLAKFVGLEAYEKAGGHIMRDLFDPEGAGWLTNIDLTQRLATEKLEAAAVALRAEGFKWVEAAPEFPWEQTQKDGRLVAGKAEPTAAQQAKIDKLQARVDALHDKYGDEPEDDEVCNQIADLNEKIEELSEGEQLWSDAQKGVSGVYVTIGHNGEIDIRRGVVKPEDKAAARRLTSAEGQGGEANEPDATAKPKGGIPASLLTELTAHKTVAAQLMLAQNSEAGLLAVTHALAVRMLYDYAGASHSSLGISGHQPAFSMAVREAVQKSPAAKKLSGVVKGWQKKLPKDPADLWAYLAKQKPEALHALLAVCAGLTVDLVQVNGAAAKASAGELVKAVKLDMADHWEASADSYFSRVPRKHVLAELNGELKPMTRQQIESMKRDQAAKTIANELKGKRWLPEALRS
jgi:ParB family chromosome partitioning protein